MLIQPCMSQQESASVVIAEMQRIRGLRFKQKISRTAFLVHWRRLRERLSATPEYQEFRQEVIERDGGKCVKCRASTRIVHHRRRVAMAPHLALSVRNGELRCDDCHADKHPWLRIER